MGGGIPVGGLVMVMEDIEAPHHMPLLRFFMAQGLVHSQPLFFATPLPSPQAFLGTLPAIASRSSGAASDNTKEVCMMQQHPQQNHWVDFSNDG